MKKYILLLLVIASSFSIINAQSVDMYGYARSYFGTLTEQDGKFSIIQNTFDLELGISDDKAAFYVNPYIYQYSEEKLDLSLRELYVDLKFGRKFAVRVGKQQIVWGKADGVFITDIISPKDLSEFLLRDFEEIRIGITSVKINYSGVNSSFELVLIPQFQPTIFADPNSIWSPKPPQVKFNIPPGFQLQKKTDYSNANVEESLENSEIAGKFSYFSGAVDFELMGGYLWDDNPSLHMLKEMDMMNKVINVTVKPEYHRLTMGGGSFSTCLFDVVVRGEGAYYDGRNFLSLDPTAEEGVVEKNYMHYLVGLDYNILGMDISAQYMEERILDYDPSLYQEEVIQTATLLTNVNYFNETLFISNLIYYGFNENDALIRPTLTYKFTDGLEIICGLNLFVGEGAGMFGQYYKNDMIYSKIKYSF